MLWINVWDPRAMFMSASSFLLSLFIFLPFDTYVLGCFMSSSPMFGLICSLLRQPMDGHYFHIFPTKVMVSETFVLLSDSREFARTPMYSQDLSTSRRPKV